MAVTVEALREKIAHIQQELAEVSAALDEIATPPAPGGDVVPRSGAEVLASLGFRSSRELQPLIDKAFAEMGIDITGPAPTPEEVQQLMLREGVKPEDNIGSRAIIEMREE